ncbi:SMI1/KNR4 family protein [Pseudovibrio sp. Ad37]|uniref:SMI1/KNR4 family protein n=1 Tax=Pseudovibrio sp. Ad37 TaxID=989422 RepID=UPI0007AED697|nr:SMI1/KNR4 family protein [Pseudovibrio sp. Ad37]KZL25137.1 hypothetical protein PsAD37_02311 [Pseudovibrio sp. Ad37]
MTMVDYDILCKPKTSLELYDEEAFREAKVPFDILQLPDNLYQFLKANNGGTPVKQLFLPIDESVFTIMTFLYLFVPRSEEWEGRITPEIQLLEMLRLSGFAEHRLFPFARTYTQAIIAYSLSKETLGEIVLIEPFEGSEMPDFSKISRIYSSLESFITSAR